MSECCFPNPCFPKWARRQWPTEISTSGERGVCSQSMAVGGDDFPEVWGGSQQPPSYSPYPTVLEVRAHTDSRGRAWGRNRGGVGRGMEVPSH